MLAHKAHSFCSPVFSPSLQSPAFSLQGPGFSIQHSLPGPTSLCIMLGHRPSRRQEVPLRNPLGWIQSQMSEKRRRQAHQPCRHNPLQRLEQPSRLYLQLARATPRMLWVRSQGSRCSEMFSSTEKTKRSLHIKLTLGIARFTIVIYSLNTQNFSIHCTKVLTLAYVPFTLLPHWLIALLYSSTLKPTKRWSLMNFTVADTSVPAHVRRSNHSSAPFSHHCSHGSPKRTNPTNFGQFTTSHTLTLLPLPQPPSITTSTQTCSLVHGAHLPPSASPSTTCPPGLRQPSMMLPRHTAPFPSSLTNGWALLSSCLGKTPLLSTPATILVLHQPEESMVSWVTRPSTSSEHMGLGQFPSGSMTTFSFASRVSTDRLTMPNGRPGTQSSCRMGVDPNTAVASGTKVKTYPMTCQQSLTKTQPTQLWTSLTSTTTHTRTLSLHTVMQTSTSSPGSLASHGSHQNPSPFRRLYL